MKEYTVSGTKYLAENDTQLLEQIKIENAHTKDLSLQKYLDDVAANVINSMTSYKISTPAKAEDVVKIWKKIGIVS